MTKALLLAAVFAAALQSTPVTFTTIARGDSSQIETAAQKTVRTAVEWAALWKSHTAEGKPPAVDFTKDMVIAIFAGTQPSAGYAVEIDRMQVTGDALVVEYRVRGPKTGDMVAQMLTSPFHIARAPAHAKVTYVSPK